MSGKKGSSSTRGTGPFFRGYDAGYAAGRRDTCLDHLSQLQAAAANPNTALHTLERVLRDEIQALTAKATGKTA